MLLSVGGTWHLPGTTTHGRRCAAPFACRVTLWIRGAVAAAVLLLLTATSTSAAEVLLILSSDVGPYHEVAAELTNRLKARGDTCQTNVLQTVQNQGDAAKTIAAADYLVAIGCEAAVWLRDHRPKGEALFYCMVSDPEGLGLTSDPTCFGVTTDIPIHQQFEVIVDALPKTRTIGLLYRSDTPKGQQLLARVEAALPDGWSLCSVPVDQYQGPAEAIDALLKQDVDVIWTAPDSEVFDIATIRSLLLQSLRRQKPVFGYSTPLVGAGALVGVGVNPRTQAAQTDELIQQRSANPTDSFEKVHVPRYEIAVNLIVADQINVKLSTASIDQAAHVFGREGK